METATSHPAFVYSSPVTILSRLSDLSNAALRDGSFSSSYLRVSLICSRNLSHFSAFSGSSSTILSILSLTAASCFALSLEAISSAIFRDFSAAEISCTSRTTSSWNFANVRSSQGVREAWNSPVSAARIMSCSWILSACAPASATCSE